MMNLKEVYEQLVKEHESNLARYGVTKKINMLDIPYNFVF